MGSAGRGQGQAQRLTRDFEVAMVLQFAERARVRLSVVRDCRRPPAVAARSVVRWPHISSGRDWRDEGSLGALAWKLVALHPIVGQQCSVA